MKILICEDNQLALKAMSVVLEREGYDPVTVSDGNRAIEELRKTDFDLAIVDIHMPYHSGLEVIRFLRTELKKQTPVLIVSAFSDPQVQRQAGEMKVSGYITKPFDPDDLLRKIRASVHNIFFCIDRNDHVYGVVKRPDNFQP
jgi:DNA-binding response OmpR family regulator